MTKIKICGITNKIDAIEAARLDVDMLGFVFYKKSPRCVTPAIVRDIANELPGFVAKVGVFVDEDKVSVEGTAEDAGLDILQFHGDETPEYCSWFKGKYKVIKAFRIKSKDDLKSVNDYDVDYFLFDNYDKDAKGGTGRTFDWKALAGFEFLKPFILSGGLTPANVEGAIMEIAPYGVDVSSGIEKSPGKKDLILMRKFVENVRRA